MRRASPAVVAAAAFVACGGAPETAFAEPHFAVAKGLPCSACHQHPAGGGQRTAYGNVYAQTELAATRVGPADADLWTGEVTRWLSVGADLRADVRYVDVPGAEERSAFELRRGTAYLRADVVPQRLSITVDQQFAPGSSLNREAYLRLNDRSGRFFVIGGQFFLPYGLRLQDDTAFVRLVTGTNFASPDRGVQLGFEDGPWSTQFAVTNGSGGGAEIDDGKQFSGVARYLGSRWLIGASASANDADGGDRDMQGLFGGLRTGPVAWLAAVDRINDDLPAGGSQDRLAGYVEANWLFARGHNLKFAWDYFDPDDDTDEDHNVRWSLLWEYTPMQFLQLRSGARIHDGVREDDLLNRDEYFIEVHGFL